VYTWTLTRVLGDHQEMCTKEKKKKENWRYAHNPDFKKGCYCWGTIPHSLMPQKSFYRDHITYWLVLFSHVKEIDFMPACLFDIDTRRSFLTLLCPFDLYSFTKIYFLLKVLSNCCRHNNPSFLFIPHKTLAHIKF
jgi:hypothetical protein